MPNINEIPDSAHQFGLPAAGDLTDLSIAQGYSDTCAIRSQEIVLRDFGIQLSQEHLIAQAEALGIYIPGGGTQPQHVGLLLEANGVSCSQYANANVFDLARELQQGKRIIIGVDSGELWNDDYFEQLEDFAGIGGGDHALIVAGIDTTDLNDIRVILTDPGTGHVAKDYPLEQFVDAWNDTGNFMVVTDAPAPVEAEGMVNFDYAAGHVDGYGMGFMDWVTSHFSDFTPYSPVNFDPYMEVVGEHADLFDNVADLIPEYDGNLSTLDVPNADLLSSGELTGIVELAGMDMPQDAMADAGDIADMDIDPVAGNGDTPSFGYSNL